MAADPKTQAAAGPPARDERSDTGSERTVLISEGPRTRADAVRGREMIGKRVAESLGLERNVLAVLPIARRRRRHITKRRRGASSLTRMSPPEYGSAVEVFARRHTREAPYGQVSSFRPRCRARPRH